ncbi:hypothetical protein EON81_09315 [bacterium]|nr:MAG: hypothetical protein EON81_09315 [bacterium]
MNTTITIDTVRIGPGVAVVPTPEQMERQVARLRAEGVSEDSTRMLSERLDTLRARLADRIERREYPFAPYGHGDMINVQRRHTKWSEGMPQPDHASIRSDLTAASIGMTPAEFGKLEPAVARAIIEEVASQTEPDAEIIGFLSTLPTF